MHVPGLKKNLISVAMLEDKGYDVVFSKGKAFLHSKTTSETWKIGVRVRNLYQLHVDGCVAMVGKAEGLVSRDDGELWHRKLGHLHHGALKILQQITTRLPKGTLAQSDQCKGCTLGKFVKATFHEKDRRTMMILKRIHTDLCGPFSVALTSKHKCYVIFVDDFSQTMHGRLFLDRKGNQWWVRDGSTKLCRPDGSVEKYKARFVAGGFSQIEGIDYEETFALVARYSSIRMILSLSAEMGWHIHQMDVKTAFLNGVIQEEVYIK
eukprot:PITA_30525